MIVFLAFPAAGAVLGLLEVLRDGVAGVDGLAGARGVTVSPDGRLVLVTGGRDDALAVFSRDASGDSLAFVKLFVDETDGVFGLDGASSVAMSPDNRHMYATGELDDSLVVFSHDVVSSTFVFVDVKTNGVGGVFGLDGASSVVVSPDGRHVFVTGESDNALAVFSRDASGDDLAFVELEENGFEGVFGLGGASSVAVHPDGSRVYVAGRLDSALAVFTRDAATGKLDFLEVHVDDVGGVDGLGQASGVAVSPDGGHVYVTGHGDDSVVVFAREASPDGLSFVEFHRDGRGDVDGLDGAESVVLSPDGGLVFVASDVDDGVAVFSRDPATGRLRFLEAVREGVDGLDGLDGAFDLAVSPDGQHLYVAAEAENALTSFRILYVLFFDDFESGNTRAWSLPVP